MSAARIVVAGSLNVDYTFTASELPAPGETRAGNRVAVEFGGKGANQAVAAARLGGAVTFLGAVGDDPAGRDALAALAADGIDVNGVQRVADMATGSAGIFVDSAGANAIVVVAGANGGIDAEVVATWPEQIAAASCLLLQLEIPLPAVLDAAQAARARGVLTILDPAPVPDSLPPELIDAADILTPNETEIERLLGTSLAPAEAASQLATRTRSVVVLTLGEKGCVLAQPGNDSRHFAAPIVKARSTVAAGDAFNGALAVALAEDSPLEDAIAFAQSAAAIAVTRDGAQRAMPLRTEL